MADRGITPNVQGIVRENIGAVIAVALYAWRGWVAVAIWLVVMNAIGVALLVMLVRSRRSPFAASERSES